MSTFPPIAEYGLLSNCEQSCLVAPNGAVEWLCLPRPDSPSVFAALLDRGAGTFRFGPSSTQVPQQRRYVPGTMVLETTWQTPTGWMIVQDFLAVGPAEEGTRRLGYRGYGRTTLTEGQSAYLVLSWGGANVPASQEEAFTALNTTIDFWRDWL